MFIKFIKVIGGIHLIAALDAFIFWGFMKRSVEWITNNSPAHELKPVYQRLKKMIHKDWNTPLKLPSNGDGVIRFQGFQGDYNLRYPLINNGFPVGGQHFSFNNYQAGRLTIQTNRL